MTLATLFALCDAWAQLAPEVQKTLRAAAAADDSFDTNREQLSTAIKQARAGLSLADGQAFALRVFLEGDNDLRAEAAGMRAKYRALYDDLVDEVVAPGHS
jgi:hypothetical protein